MLNIKPTATITQDAVIKARQLRAGSIFVKYEQVDCIAGDTVILKDSASVFMVLFYNSYDNDIATLKLNYNFAALPTIEDDNGCDCLDEISDKSYVTSIDTNDNVIELSIDVTTLSLVKQGVTC